MISTSISGSPRLARRSSRLGVTDGRMLLVLVAASVLGGGLLLLGLAGLGRRFSPASPGPEHAASTGSPRPDDLEMPEDAQRAPMLAEEGDGGALSGIVRTSERVEIEVPDDEGNLVGVYGWSHSETMADSRWIQVRAPRALVELERRGVVAVSGEEARVMMIGQEAKAGRITGRVRIAVYEDRQIGSGWPGPEATPSTWLETEGLEFDASLFQVSTAERFTVRTTEAAVVGRGLLLLLNEGEDRVESLRIDERERIVLRAGSDGATPTAVASRPGRTGPRAPDAPPPPPPLDRDRMQGPWPTDDGDDEAAGAGERPGRDRDGSPADVRPRRGDADADPPITYHLRLDGDVRLARARPVGARGRSRRRARCVVPHGFGRVVVDGRRDGVESRPGRRAPPRSRDAAASAAAHRRTAAPAAARPAGRAGRRCAHGSRGSR